MSKAKGKSSIRLAGTYNNKYLTSKQKRRVRKRRNQTRGRTKGFLK